MSDSPPAQSLQQTPQSQPKGEDYDKQLEQLKHEQSVYNTWESLKAHFQDQKLSRESSFQSIDTAKAGSIDKAVFVAYVKDLPVEGVQTLSPEIFELINQGDKVDLQAWSNFWLQSLQQAYETEHKIQILNQKQNIFHALETNPTPGQRLEDSKLASKYQNMVDRKIKNSSSLGDITQMLNSNNSSPFKKKTQEPYQLASQPFQMAEERKMRPPSAKKVDNLLNNYKTPRKDEIESHELSVVGRPSFLTKETVKQSSPQGITKFQAKSPYVKSTLNQNHTQSQLIRPEVSTKVEKSMNINFDNGSTISGKTNRRKEDLSSYMSKLGLGKYDAPRVTVDLIPQQEKKSLKNMDLDRLKSIVQNNKDAYRDPKKGLSELVNDPNFANGSFRRVKQDHQRAPSRSNSRGKEGLSLVDQSLKNYTMKLIHHHKYSSPTMGDSKQLMKRY